MVSEEGGVERRCIQESPTCVLKADVPLCRKAIGTTLSTYHARFSDDALSDNRKGQETPTKCDAQVRQRLGGSAILCTKQVQIAGKGANCASARFEGLPVGGVATKTESCGVAGGRNDDGSGSGNLPTDKDIPRKRMGEKVQLPSEIPQRERKSSSFARPPLKLQVERRRSATMGGAGGTMRRSFNGSSHESPLPSNSVSSTKLSAGERNNGPDKRNPSSEQADGSSGRLLTTPCPGPRPRQSISFDLPLDKRRNSFNYGTASRGSANNSAATSPGPGGTVAKGESDEYSEAEEDHEDLGGVPLRKPFERPAANEEDDTANKQPAMTHHGFMLQQTSFFKGFSQAILQHLSLNMDERVFRAGEVIYREGDKQQWLGLLEVGSASVHVQTSEMAAGDSLQVRAAGNSSVRVAVVACGAIFGELAVLGVREARTSTLIAEADCKVSLIESKSLWSACETYEEEIERLKLQCSRWKAFLASRIAATCHPEIAYQLRMSSEHKTLAVGETITLGRIEREGEVLDPLMKCIDASAILETGRVVTAGPEKKESHNPGAILGDAVILGVRGAMTIVATEGPCNLVYISRQVFWSFVALLTREREAFTKMALERLPPATFDISSCPILGYFQGSAGFGRVIQSLVRQRVCHPGMDICKTDESNDSLLFFQQGSGEVLLSGHKVGQVQPGAYCGEMNFLTIASRSTVTVRAQDFCVLQLINRTEVEPHLQRHHTVRARFRELSKLRPHYKRDSASELQTRQLAEIIFFHNVAESFLHDVHNRLEDRIYLPKQVIVSARTTMDFMCILLNGAADKVNEDSNTEQLGPGDIVGEMGLLCVSLESRETVVATAVCCVQILHRILLIETLHKHPNEKHHFECIAKQSMMLKGVSNTDGEQHSNIYMLPFFKNCGSRFLYLLDLHLERHIFFSDEVIVREGTEGEEMFIMYHGGADVEVKGVKVGHLQGGQCFGEMAVLGLAKKRTATIVARTLCDVRILSSRSLEAAIKEFPEERARFESLAATRNRISKEKKCGGKAKQTSMFFQDCDPIFAATVSELMEDQLYMEGQALMKEGDRGECLFLIHQGVATVTANGEHIADLGEGDIAGEMAVLGISTVRTATVTAKEVCFVQVLNKAQLLPVLKNFPAERHKIRLKAAHRLECRSVSDTIRHLEIFRGSPRPFADFLDSHTQRRVFFNDDIIMREGCTGRHLIMIFSGRVAIDVGGEIVAELGAGEVLGELTALRVMERRSATVYCRDICDVYVLAHRFLNAALHKWPEQRAKLRALGARRMRENVERKTKETFLLNCPLFEQCSAKFLQCISMHLEDRLFMAGEQLCIEGDRGDAMFILVQGILDCIVGDKKVSELHQGSIIGEIAVLGLSSVRTATLRAKDVCLVQMLHRPVFMKYLAEFPREMIHFQEVGAARLEKIPIAGDANIFRQQLLFRDCDSAFLDRLSEHLSRKFFFAGQKIIKEGTESNDMYAIHQGQAVVEKRGVSISEVEAGLCFGEMAVMGVATMQTVTVRAETLCDMQVLSRWDLETLLGEFNTERTRLLRVIASMMREDLAEVTNFEILTEIPLLHDADPAIIPMLNTASQVELARKDELMFGVEDDAVMVILQGSASVEVTGVPVRLLSEGDAFGSVAVLGLRQERNVSVRATSVCLWLSFTRKALENVCNECLSGNKFLQSYAKTFHMEPGFRLMILRASPALQHLGLEEEQLAQVLSKCEEIVFFPDEVVLSSHQRSQAMVCILVGKATMGVGRDAIALEVGSVLGDLSTDPIEHGDLSVHAKTECMVLMLHRRSFFKLLDSWLPEEKKRILAKLETVPWDRRSEAKLSGVGLRQCTDRLTKQCFLAARMSLKSSSRGWGGTKPKKQARRGWSTLKAGMFVARVLGSMGREPERTKRKTLADYSSNETAASSSYGNMTFSQVQLEEQEQHLCHDLCRFTLSARFAAREAEKDQAKLRKKADELREWFAMQSVRPDTSQDEVQALRRSNCATDRRVKHFQARLDEAYAQREELLNRLLGHPEPHPHLAVA